MNNQDIFDEDIDPNRFGVKELLRHLYRDFQEFKISFENRETQRMSEIETLKKRIDSLEQFKSFTLGLSKAVLLLGTFAGLIIAIAELIIKR